MKRCVLRSQKGFTLVELMIVVVIMGILVAVAIPVYNSITKNAHRNTCHSNCEILEKAATQYMFNTNNEDVSGIVQEDAPVVISNSDEFYEKFPTSYTDNVNKPLDIFDSGCVYTFYYFTESKSVLVICNYHGDKLGNDYSGNTVK